MNHKEYQHLKYLDSRMDIPCTTLVAQFPRKVIKTLNTSRVIDSACRFTPNVLGGFCALYKSISKCCSRQWFCGPLTILKCNGYSECVHDECSCSNVDVFYCADGRGCVTFRQTCDMIPNCLDGSDERVCPNLQYMAYKNATLMVSSLSYCRINPLEAITYMKLKDYSKGNSKVWKNCSKKTSALTKCFDEVLYDHLHDVMDFTGTINVTHVNSACRSNCTGVDAGICDRIVYGAYMGSLVWLTWEEKYLVLRVVWLLTVTLIVM